MAFAGVALDGRVALVTGAGSPEGIGFAAARTLAARGARVAITATTERIPELVAELGAFGVVADLTADESARRVVSEVEDRLGAIDVLGGNLLQERKLGSNSDALVASR